MHRLVHRRTTQVFLFALVVLLNSWAIQAATKLQFALWINDPVEVTEVKKLIEQYESENPGIEIELYHQPFSGYHDKMTTLALSGMTPDVMAVSRVFLASYADNGFVQPIGHLLPQFGVNVTTDVTELDSGTYRGEIYGIPIWGGPYIMAYNVDLLEQAGLQPAGTVYRNGDWTWDTFIDMGKKLTQDLNGDGRTDRWAISTPIAGEVDWAAKVGQFGGQVFNAERTRSLINSPEAIEALTLWADIALVHQIAPTPNLPEGVFAAGTQVFLGRWASETINLGRQIGSNFRVDLVPQPAGPAGHFHIAGGVPITVSASTEHLEESVKFAVWYTMESDQWKLRGIPANVRDLREGYRDLLAAHFANPDAILHALTSPTQMEPANGIHQAAITTAWTPSLLRLRGGIIPAQTAAAEIEQLLNKIVAP